MRGCFGVDAIDTARLARALLILSPERVAPLGRERLPAAPVHSAAAWLLGHVRRVVTLLSPDYGCGHALETLYANLGDDPTRLVWPLLLLGPERVAAVGRERLLSAPVWAEVLDYGGIWLQVTENPFTASERDLAPLAKHLGLGIPVPDVGNVWFARS